MKNLILTFVFAIISLVSFSQGRLDYNVIVSTDINTIVIDSTWFGYSGGASNTFALRAYNKYNVYILDTDSIVNVKFKYLSNNNPAADAYSVLLNNEPLGFISQSQWDTVIVNEPLININHDSLTKDTVYTRAINSDGINAWFKIVKVTQEQWNDIQLGINDLELTTTRLSAYPNPASSNITIDFDVTTNEVPVVIFSMGGQLVYSNDDNRNNGTNSLNVDVSGFQTGIYIVKAGSQTFKFVKQ